MAKGKPRKLKVYQARIGFYDTIVSAPNRTAALRAWGTHQNLFAGDEARETRDPQAVEAALAHPHTPLRRGIGTGDPFGLDPNLPSLPDEPAPGRKATATAARRKTQAGSHTQARRPDGPVDGRGGDPDARGGAQTATSRFPRKARRPRR